MCRNITELRGLQPPATDDEITAAAAQFVRKVTGIGKPNPSVAPKIDDAVHQIAHIMRDLLGELPERRGEPTTVPPLRRPQVRARLGLAPFEG
ncbi:DUF2277 domain-containing protein [Cryptosporangium phraense]|uniref:DUF2277 domain-containing protein n=1 Tax=Cryptosporangium phraense TaxID=2593070 RepID=A0A545AXB6_9ACTN|nr:DUF2277 domain-containing protein [Cryptosporangium phraense]TQS45948.1 DUF2277 domain-containing protein [Cryptosporangium phraense]